MVGLFDPPSTPLPLIPNRYPECLTTVDADWENAHIQEDQPTHPCPENISFPTHFPKSQCPPPRKGRSSKFVSG